MPRQIGCAMRNGMSAARRVAIPALATTSAACKLRLARYGLRSKLRQQTFETAIIERYRRRESVEEALIEMYLAGGSVRRVEDITEALWGTRGVAPDGV